MVQKALEAHSVQVGEEVEQGLAAGDLNRPIEPAVGSLPLHGRTGFTPWRVMPRPSSVWRPNGIGAGRSSAAAGRPLLVHDPQQLGEFFGTAAAVAAADSWLAELAPAAPWAGTAASS